MASDVAIRLATRRDIAAMMALEARYYVDNLDPSERANGFISNLQSQDWFTWAVDSAGVHVAVTDDDSVVGFIAVTDPPGPAQVGLSPIVQAVVDLAETLEFNGKPISQYRFALRGPVCVDEAARGRGVYTAFNAATRAAYRGRFDLGVLFVAADNPRSLHTSTTKLGATSLAVFEVDSQRYHFLAFSF
ncbi:hypothetical protein BayCH28_03680 [Mycolicibacterium sp. CH28]|uniref:hypothetical protein n=1 Tax=Mycolicibacterium sp. CH28 TaxID=2512237 RepID=UPI0010805057|nr:hypothetical protein [Mycolicibacterium sp. CH28]TGD89711.1 hypothetical protein BayCH28_03680 [Mycolicibacterium sp. CH28]